MKNVLVISENFTRGGLETQIDTFYQELKNKVNFTFIFGTYNGEWDFDDSKIYTGIKFDESSSINDFKKTVEKIVEIINDNKIDIIHVHPYFLSIPAVFAAQITKIPICYTYHGFGSITFPGTINIQTIFTYSLNEIFSKVFSVYNDIASDFNKHFRNVETVFLPNPIDVSRFKKATISYKSVWAMTCRISRDKIDSICDIMSSLDELGINELHLYGSGEEENYIKDFIKKNKLSDRVFMRGYVSDVNKALKKGYTGVIGMGRSASEAIAMQLPVMLVGYGKNCGIIDKNTYKNAMNNNFAPIFMKSVDNEFIKKQVLEILENDYHSDIYSSFLEDCSSKNVSSKYFKEMCKCDAKVRSNFIYFYNEIKKIDSDECFSTSDIIFNLSYIYLKMQSLDLDLNNTMVYYRNILQKNNDIDIKIYQKNKEIDMRINEIDKKINEINNSTIDNLSRKINIKFMTVNSFRIIKEKIKKLFKK